MEGASETGGAAEPAADPTIAEAIASLGRKIDSTNETLRTLIARLEPLVKGVPARPPRDERECDADLDLSLPRSMQHM